MSLRVALQMDPPDQLNVKKDSTYLIGLGAQRRDHELFWYHPSSLTFCESALSANVSTLEFKENPGDHYACGDAIRTNLNDFDLILMRQDFVDPLSYSATAHLLDHVSDKTLILNDPKGVRESPEKMLVTHFPEIIPPTIISRDFEQIQEFYKEYKDIIFKPLNGFGGLDIFHIHAESKNNLQCIYDMMIKQHSEPFVIQKYLPDIKTKGDKRIIVIEGEPVGSFTRIAQDGSARANLAAGGRAEPSELTDRDREICETIKPELIKRGLVLVGLDVIGDYATEINPKSPTGMRQINDYSGIKCEELAWSAFEKRYEDHRRNN